MALSSIFQLREKETQGIIDLLESVSLGTNGAKYRHLDTAKRIKKADNPLFLSMEKNDRVLGNVTFCRRGPHWYIRYFAFASFMQSAGTRKSGGKSSGVLKRELAQFFNDVFNGRYTEEAVESLYAYIDPKNEKSLWMSENFNFETVGKVATQTFSRVRSKNSPRVKKINNWKSLRPLVEREFGNYKYYHTTHTQEPPFYVLESEEGEILAFTKINIANWKIERLPGRFGGFLTKLIPWVPVLNRLIRPEKHTFIVPEAVWVKDEDATLLNELFESILYQERINLMIWWVDVKSPIYSSVRNKVTWGLLHRILGKVEANIVVLSNPEITLKDSNEPFFITGFDFI